MSELSTEPRADDPAALVAEGRGWHVDGTDHLGNTWSPWCYTCQAEYPCLPARLADALASASAEIEERERRRLAYARQVAGATEAARKEHADALAASRDCYRRAVEQEELWQDAWEQVRAEAAELRSMCLALIYVAGPEVRETARKELDALDQKRAAITPSTETDRE